MTGALTRMKIEQYRTRIRWLEDQVELLESRVAKGVEKQLLLLERLITADDRIATHRGDEVELELHLNPGSQLAPVDCPLLIEIEPGVVTDAVRTGYISDRSGAMEYRLSNGSLVQGRYAWTYP